MKMLYKYKEFINENFYDDFKKFSFINENFYDDFKSTYFKLFNESDEDIKNQLNTLFKKIDDETDYIKITKIFDDFLTANQNTLNDKISKSGGSETINKLLSDNLKSIYFALDSIKLKLNDDDFVDIFEKSKDKNFVNLMSMDKDKFSDAVSVYVKDYMIPQIEKMAGVQKVQESKIYEQDEPTQPTQPTQPEPTQETEPAQEEPAQQEQNKQLETYKEKSTEWFYYIYGMIWDKLKKVKNKMTTNRIIINNIDQLSKLMPNSDNVEAKKQLLKKVTTLSKEGLNTLADVLKLNKDEIGEF